MPSTKPSTARWNARRAAASKQTAQDDWRHFAGLHLRGTHEFTVEPQSSGGDHSWNFVCDDIPVTRNQLHAWEKYGWIERRDTFSSGMRNYEMSDTGERAKEVKL